MKKIERASLFLKESLSLFACPICHGNFTAVENNQVTCLEGHAFNLSKKGTVYFLTKPTKDQYDKELFEARKNIADHGFWQPILEVISGEIKSHTNVLDVGTGNGSHLSWLKNQDTTINAIGMDISKAGVEMAAKNHWDIFWMVADLANIPIADNSLDTIINIFTPSNYKEFKRALKDTGQVIKVVPNTGYLKEIRQLSSQKTYSNNEVVQNFAKEFSNFAWKEVSYQQYLPRELISDLIKMTPLGWQLDESQAQKLLRTNGQSISVDVSILIGKY